MERRRPLSLPEKLTKGGLAGVAATLVFDMGQIVVATSPGTIGTDALVGAAGGVIGTVSANSSERPTTRANRVSRRVAAVAAGGLVGGVSTGSPREIVLGALSAATSMVVTNRANRTNKRG